MDRVLPDQPLRYAMRDGAPMRRSARGLSARLTTAIRGGATVLGLCLAVAGCGTAGAPLSDEVKDVARRAYYDGMRELVDGDYLKASRLFQAVAASPRHVKYASLAKLRLGDALYYQGRYAEATELYRGFIQQYNTDPNLPYARFKVAESYYQRIPGEWLLSPPAHEFDQILTQQAEAELKGFVSTFPTSQYAPEARRMLAGARSMLFQHELYAVDFYAQREKWQAVAWRLKQATETYPELAEREDLVWRMASAWRAVADRGETAKALGLYLTKFPDGPHKDEARSQMEAIRKAVEEEQKNTPAPKVEPKKAEPAGPEDGAEPEAEPDKDGTPSKDSFKLKMPELTPLPE